MGKFYGKTDLSNFEPDFANRHILQEHLFE